MDNPYEPPKFQLEKEKASTHSEIDDFNLASRWLRLGGYLLDFLFAGVPAIGLAYLVGVYENMDRAGNLPLADHLVALVIGFSTFMIINGFLIYERGQTVGKLICNTMVVTLDGKQVSGNRYVFLRLLPLWIAVQIPVLGLILELIDLLLIFRKDKNCLHDDIAGTRVVVKTSRGF
jgi:uncharacterized RDD family membrane protein YckC